MSTTISKFAPPRVAGEDVQPLPTQSSADALSHASKTKPLSSGNPAFSKLATIVKGTSSAQSAARTLTRRFNAKTSPAADLVMQARTASKFVSQNSAIEMRSLLDKLTQPPADIESLSDFADTLNKVYDSFDHRMHDTDAADYHAEMRQWSSDTQKSLYSARDRILQANPDQLRRFGVDAQFSRKFPGEQKPEQLSQFEHTHGQILFSGDVRNDCGFFANALRTEIKLKQTASFITENGLDKKKEISDQHLAALVNTPVSKASRTDKLVYDKDSPLPYPHHVKTAIAQANGQIFTLEANTGKPFLLAPELLAHESEDALLEKNDTTIEHRQSTSVANELRQELGSAKTPKERYASAVQTVNSHIQTAKPLGQNSAPTVTLPNAAPASLPKKDFARLF